MNKKQIKFENIPMQPTDNHLYFNRPKGGRAPTAKYKSFINAFNGWCYFNWEHLSKATALFAPNEILDVDIKLYFPWEKLWTKDNRPKVLDGQNRMKALLDCLAKKINRDDRNFWKVSVEKIAVKELNESNVTVILTERDQDVEDNNNNLAA